MHNSLTNEILDVIPAFDHNDLPCAHLEAPETKVVGLIPGQLAAYGLRVPDNARGNRGNGSLGPVKGSIALTGVGQRAVVEKTRMLT